MNARIITIWIWICITFYSVMRKIALHLRIEGLWGLKGRNRRLVFSSSLFTVFSFCFNGFLAIVSKVNVESCVNSGSSEKVLLLSTILGRKSIWCTWIFDFLLFYFVICSLWVFLDEENLKFSQFCRHEGCYT